MISTPLTKWYAFSLVEAHEHNVPLSLQGLEKEVYLAAEIDPLLARVEALDNLRNDNLVECHRLDEEIINLKAQLATLLASQAALEEALKELHHAASSLVCTSPYHFEGNDVTLAEALDVAKIALRQYKFDNVFCSQCGQTFGPGDHGYSHCTDHRKAQP